MKKKITKLLFCLFLTYSSTIVFARLCPEITFTTFHNDALTTKIHHFLDIAGTSSLSASSSSNDTTTSVPDLIPVSKSSDKSASTSVSLYDNLITNGDFEQGNVGFTSNHNYKSGTGATLIYATGSYGIATDPKLVHNAFASMVDHTTGTGKMMVVNGSTAANVVVWSQKVSGIKPNTKYLFSAYLASCTSSAPAILSFTINNQKQGDNISPNGVAAWTQFYAEWNSGSTTGDAIITITNLQAGDNGNDFALDDISFTEAPKPCAGTLSIIEKDDMGTGTANWGDPLDGITATTNYTYSTSTMGPGKYGRVKNPFFAGVAGWADDTDHTGNGGYMLIFDASATPGIYYERAYSNLCSGIECNFSIQAANLATNPAWIRPKVKIELLHPTTKAVLQSFNSQELAPSATKKLLWNELSMSFTVPAGLSSVIMRVSNIQPQNAGNDIGFDDVVFSICVPELKIDTGENSKKICKSTSTTLTIADLPDYHFQWQSYNGTDWKDIPNETNKKYVTPILTTDTKYRVRYAATGIDIANNNGLKCSGNSEILVEVAPAPSVKVTVIPAEGTLFAKVTSSTNDTNQTTKLADKGFTSFSRLTANANTGTTICVGGTGFLTTEPNPSIATTTFTGHWNSDTDPKAYTVEQSMKNSTACKFSATSIRNYTASTFTVSVSGTYVLKMKDTDAYDGAAYIYTGGFTPGNCSGGGTWIIGDDDTDGRFAEPRLTAYFNAGVTYTLISTLWATNSGTYVGDYTWTITPPTGGQFLLNTLNYWYTSPTGGNPIGWGDTFNPVGVTGSVIRDNKSAQSATYYVSNEKPGSVRTPLVFEIVANNTVGQASSRPTVNVNEKIPNITHTTTGVASIGTPINLPPGVAVALSSNNITISGTPTAAGVYNYTIPLTGVCGNTTATGTITVNTILTANITGTISVCMNQTTPKVTFTANNGQTPYTFTYSINGGPDLTATTGITENSINIDVPMNVGTFIYTLKRVKDVANEQLENGKFATIQINKQPAVKVSLNPVAICSGSVATFNFQGPSYGKITYSIDGINQTIELDDEGFNSISEVVTNDTKLIIISIKDIYNASCSNVTINEDVPLNVTAASKAFTASTEPVVCAGMPIQNITHTTAGATGINTTGATKLPPGVTASWNSNTITISGTPTAAGIYNYSIPLTGGCGSAAATGKITVTSQSETRTTTNATICMGETGLLSAVTGSGIIPAPVTVFADRWNVATDLKSLMPTPIENNLPTCKFYPDTYGSYKTITFSVNVTGTYSLQMTGANMYFRAGYLYKGNYVLGTCPGDGTWITGDDDFGFIGAKNPTLTAHLEVGTLYTLVSIINAYNDPNYSTGYTWTLTPPEGGGFYLTPLNLWYTSATGGDPIGWGPYLNPVETPNSGIVNQPGATTFYAGDATGCTTRVPAIFTILENNTAGAASSAPSEYVNTVLPAITHTTTKATGIDIGAATGLPAGITASWAANTITIHGTPTIAGDYDYSIPITGGCGNIAATGKITVKPANTITLTSANATQNIFIKNAITNIVYTTNASGVTVTGLPAGVTGVFNAGIFTISGTPTTEGIFDFTVTTTGSTTVSLTGTITVSSIPLSAWIMMEDDNRNGLIEPGEKLKFKLYVANIDPNHAPLLNVSGSIDLPVHTTPAFGTNGQTPNRVSFFDSFFTEIPYYWDMVTKEGGPYVAISANADCNLTDVSKIDVIGRVYINGVQVKMSVPVLSSNPTAEWIALNGDATKSYCIPPDLENCTSPTGCPSSFPVNINPKLTIAKPAAVCSGSTLNLTAPEITIGTPLKTKNWYLDGTIFTPTTVVTTADNGKTLQYKASNNCSDESSNSVTITVNANPDVPVIVSTASTCSKAGTSTISNYISGNTYTFSPTGPGVDTQGLINSMTVGTLYDVTSKDANCTSLASAQFKNGSQLAAPEAPTCTKADPITCAILTGSITVTAPIGTNYQYAIDGGTYQSSPVFSIVSKGGHSVTVKEISTGCISAGQNVTINAAPSAPTAAISYPASSYTNVGTAAITQTGQTGGTYSATPAGLSINATTGIIDLSESLLNTYTVTYAFSNASSCTNTATTAVTVTGPQITAWLSVRDGNGNGIIEPGERINFLFEMANMDPNHVTLENVKGSVKLPNNTTLVSATDIFLYPNTHSFSNPEYLSFPYLWDLSYQRQAAMSIDFIADCDLTGVDRIETVGIVFVNGVEVKVSAPPINLTDTAKYINAGGSNLYIQPPALVNCPGGCPTGLPVSAIKAQDLQVNNPTAICAPATVDITAAAITSSSTGIGSLTYFTDALGTVTLTTPKAVATSGTYYIKSTITPKCFVIKPVVVTVNPLSTVTFTKTDPTTCAVATGSITVTAPLGANYVYALDNGAYQSEVLFEGVASGNHTITAKETVSGCIPIPANVAINAAPSAPQKPTFTKTDPTTCVVVTGSITVTAPVGAGYQYAIDGGTYQSSPVFSIISTGNHSVTVKEILTGCISAGQNVTINAAPSAPTAAISYPASSYTNVGTAEITRTGQAGGTYSAIPAGLSINATTGIINLSESKLNTYTVTYAFSNASSCTNTATTAVTVTGPQITAWLSVVDANKNGIVESGETLTFMLEMANIDPNHVTLKNVTGSVKLPAHTTLISSDIYVYPNTFTFSSLGNLDFPYIWNLGWMRQPAIVVRVRADCDLTGVDKIETIGMVYVDGVEVKVSSAPVKVSDAGTYKIINSDDDSYLQPPALANCQEGCPTGLSVSTIKKQELQVNNPPTVCALATVDITTAVITSGSIGIGALTYFTDEAATQNLTTPTAVTTSGTYYIKSTIAPNCFVIEPVAVTVSPKPEEVVTIENICFGEKYTWAANGIEYSESASITLEKDGCTPDQVLKLTVGTKPQEVVTIENICFGEKYTWAANGIEYSESASITLEKDGCTPDQVLKLTVGTKPQEVVTIENICFGEKYTWAANGIEYSESASITLEKDGCTPDQVLKLTVGTKPQEVVTIENICFGEKYTWAVNGIEYSESASINLGKDGCTPDQVLKLTVGTKPEEVVTIENICFGEKYTWAANGIEYSESASITLEKDGCTPDQVLKLTVGTKPEEVVTIENICSGEKYTWAANGIEYSESASINLEKDGCTPDQVLKLTVGTKPEEVVTIENICFGEKYTWAANGIEYSESASITLEKDGCTPDQVLKLTVGTKPEEVVTIENICFGEKYTWAANGIEYSESASINLEKDGCTPDQVLKLTVGTKPEEVVTIENICFGEKYTWAANGIEYSESASITLEKDGCT
ncbi:hypothetical protein, partial [Flavobacterium pectinovorum]